MNKIIIIGSGLSGYNLARELRKLDKESELCIITKENGDYFSKPILSTAFTAGKTAEELPVLKKENLLKQLNAEIKTETTVTSIDSKANSITLENGELIKYDRLVLALGAKTISPNIPGDASDKIFSINSLDDYKKFRSAFVNKKSVTILGSGLIGCEFANDLLNAEVEVNLVSLSDVPLNNMLPIEASNALLDSLKRKGINWYGNNSVTSVNAIDKNRVSVELKNGETLTSDLVITAIGLKPNTDLAKDTGLEVNRGIVVNEYLETTDENIYALGDCAEVCGHVLQYILPLNQCARALAKTLAGEKTAVEYPAMPVNIKTPACPILVSPPNNNVKGEWKIESAGNHIRAVYVDENNDVHGYVLTGDRVKERLQMTNIVPPIF